MSSDAVTILKADHREFRRLVREFRSGWLPAARRGLVTHGLGQKGPENDGPPPGEPDELSF